MKTNSAPSRTSRFVAATGFLVSTAAALSIACSAGGEGLGGDDNGAGNANGSGGSGNGNGQGGGFAAAPGTGNVGNTGFGGNFNVGGGAGGGGGAAGLYVPPTGEPECIIPDPPGSVPPQLITVDNCTGQIDAGTQAALEAGGSAAGMRWLYPYDGTVFPVGLAPPEMMWEQTGSPTAVRVHMKSQYFEYFGCFGANANFQLTIPQDVWDTAEVQGQGSGDPLTVELTTMAGGTVSGPLTSTWYIAQGKLQGQLFYNTYTSPQAGNNGAVMRLHLGAAQPEVFLTDTGLAPFGPCWSCHSLSASGNVLVAQHHAYPAGPYTSASFNLGVNPNPSPPPMVTLDGNLAEMGLGAVSPDGSKVLTMGSPGNTATSGQVLFPDAPGNVPAMIGPKVSKLLDTATGAEIAMPGWTVQYAKMPSFSPDGSVIAFNWHEDSDGHSLAVADFDQATNTASNIRVIYNNATLYPGWPFVTPDNREVIFVLGDAPDYVSAYPGRPITASSSLHIVDIATGNARPLAWANGYRGAGGATYLPRPGRDENYEFFPTISPVASGGYFWLFFTSRRTYGNRLTQIVDDAPTKKIWVTAISIRPPGADAFQDPSAPAFYLPGQEAAAGNIRAFAALEPCRVDGTDCETGIDCCVGQCSNGKCGPPQPPPPICMQPPPPPCSQIGDRCNNVGDCCPDSTKDIECINGYCSVVEPVIIR